MRELWREVVYYLGLLTYFGITMAASTFVGFWLGSTLDGWLNISNYLFTIIGAATGAIAGLVSIYRIATSKLDKSNKENH